MLQALEPRPRHPHLRPHAVRHLPHPLRASSPRCTPSPRAPSASSSSPSWRWSLLGAFALLAWRWSACARQGELDSIVSRESAFLLNNVLPRGRHLHRLLRHRVPAPVGGRARRQGQRGRALLQPGQHPAVPGADLPDGRGAAHRLAPRLRRQPQAQLPVAGGRSGVVAAVVLRLLGVGNRAGRALAGAVVFVAATIALDFVRAARARRRAMGDGWRCRALGGLLLRQNRRYGGFVVHLGILVVALGVTGSQAWSVQTETTLKRGESAELAGYRVRFDGLAARRGVEPLQGDRHLHGRGRTAARRHRAAPGQEVLPAGADADRLRGLPARASSRTSTWCWATSPATAPRPPSRCRSTAWCPGSGSAASSSPWAPLLAILPERGGDPRDASRWPLAHPAGGGAGAGRCWPTASALNPRDMPSPLVRQAGRAVHAHQLRRRKPLRSSACAARSSSSTSGPRGAIPPATRRRRPSSAAGARTGTAASSSSAWTSRTRTRPARKFISRVRPHLPERARPGGHGLGRLRRLRRARDVLHRPRRAASASSRWARVTDEMFARARRARCCAGAGVMRRGSCAPAAASARRSVAAAALGAAPAAAAAGATPSERCARGRRRSCAAWSARASRWPTRRPRRPTRCAAIIRERLAAGETPGAGAPVLRREVRRLDPARAAAPGLQSPGVGGPAGRRRRWAWSWSRLLHARLDARGRRPTPPPGGRGDARAHPAGARARAVTLGVADRPGPHRGPRARVRAVAAARRRARRGPRPRCCRCRPTRASSSTRTSVPRCARCASWSSSTTPATSPTPTTPTSARATSREAAAILSELDRLGPAPPPRCSRRRRRRPWRRRPRRGWRHPRGGRRSARWRWWSSAWSSASASSASPSPSHPWPAPAGARRRPLTEEPSAANAPRGPVTPEMLRGHAAARPARASTRGRYNEAIAAYQAVLKRDPEQRGRADPPGVDGRDRRAGPARSGDGRARAGSVRSRAEARSRVPARAPLPRARSSTRSARTCRARSVRGRSSSRCRRPARIASGWSR